MGTLSSTATSGLAKKVVDVVRACAAAGIPCWGPPKESARLEASKEFAKQFLVRHGIPTGGYAGVNSIEEARAAIAGTYPTVLKFDGLAAGKGVAVCPDELSAEEFLTEVLVERKFGAGRLLARLARLRVLRGSRRTGAARVVVATGQHDGARG